MRAYGGLQVFEKIKQVFAHTANGKIHQPFLHLVPIFKGRHTIVLFENTAKVRWV